MSLPVRERGRPARPQKSNCERGSALLLSLWALLLLSAAVLAWFGFINREIDFEHEANFSLEARAMAYSGLNVAILPTTTPRTPLLVREVDASHRYEVRMIGEGGRLNVNWLLAGEDPGRLELLKNFLAELGLDFKQRERFVDCLLDWVDADSVKRLNGQEAGPNYEPPNRALQSIDEMTQVAGSEPLLEVEGWENHFTVLSRGQIDVMAADELVLSVVPGMGEARAERLVTWRRGEDGIDNTEDDPLMENIGQVRSYLGFSEDQFASISSMLSFRDSTWRVECKGTAVKVDRHLEVVFRKVSDRARILSWQEF